MCIAFGEPDSVSPGKTKKGKIRPRYKNVEVQMIFDVNTEEIFTRKA